MSGDLKALGRIARAILDSEKASVELITEAEALSDWFEARSSFRIEPAQDIASGETWLDSGRAVSPTMAAFCLRELARTTDFIRGLGMAIQDAMQPGRVVQVLYAGCGPYATLAVPLMTIFTPQEVRFTLLDIHQCCLDEAESLIDSLGLSDHVEAYTCEDATRYSIPVNNRPDVIVS